MKNLTETKKRVINAIRVIVLAVMVVLAVAACSKKGSNESERLQSKAPVQKEDNTEKKMTLVIGSEDEKVYDVDLNSIKISEGLISVMDYLKENEGLEYSKDDSGYGAYLTQAGDLVQDTDAGEYIYLYTSVEKDADVSEYATTKDYNGEVLNSSGVGASEMTIEDGCTIYIGTVKY